MYSIVDEIFKIRNGRSYEIDKSNSSRYRLVAIEDDGTKTAYYFGVPIYNVQTGKMLDLKFHEGEKYCYMMGSNADITVGESIRLENKNDICNITMPEGYTYVNERCVAYNGAEIYPTTNGIACRAICKDGKDFVFTIRTGKPFNDIKCNGKYFAFMLEKFRPFATVSCIGAMDDHGEIIAPAELKSKKKGDGEYEISVSTGDPKVQSVLFEVNLQEEKLIHDTTVESKNPELNNSFGGTAFLGNTKDFGEQWLYARPDHSKMDDLFEHSIQNVVLYIPTYDQNDALLYSFGLETRFCSFGSNWSNKKPATNMRGISNRIKGYHKIDVTNIMVEFDSIAIRSEGWILKNASKNSRFSVISTGDNYYAPQILEVHFN